VVYLERFTFCHWLTGLGQLDVISGPFTIAATPVVMAVHQNHDYSHHLEGKVGLFKGDEAVTNNKLAGGSLHTVSLIDATHLLMSQKLRLTHDLNHLLRRRHTLPILYPWLPLRLVEKAVNMSRPLRSRFGLALGSLLRRAEK